MNTCISPDGRFRPGDSVRVVLGPFAQLTGIVTNVPHEHTKICIDINIFGRTTPVELEENQIVKVV